MQKLIAGLLLCLAVWGAAGQNYNKNKICNRWAEECNGGNSKSRFCTNNEDCGDLITFTTTTAPTSTTTEYYTSTTEYTSPTTTEYTSTDGTTTPYYTSTDETTTEYYTSTDYTSTDYTTTEAPSTTGDYTSPTSTVTAPITGDPFTGVNPYNRGGGGNRGRGRGKGKGDKKEVVIVEEKEPLGGGFLSGLFSGGGLLSKTGGSLTGGRGGGISGGISGGSLGSLLRGGSHSIGGNQKSNGLGGLVNHFGAGNGKGILGILGKK